MGLRHQCLFFLTSGICLGASGAWANDTEGLFAGIRVGHELADVEYAKAVRYNDGVGLKTGTQSETTGPTSMTAEDGAADGFNAFMTNVGYRTFLSARVYLSGEVEGAVYSNIDYASGDGTTEASAYVPHNFDVDEVGVSLGYARSFTLGR